LEQPLLGYFAATYTTGKIKGELQTIVGHRNHAKLIDLERAIEQKIPKGVSISAATTILKATYTDSLRKENEEYFLVLGGSVQRISQAEGQLQWNRMKSGHAKTPNIDLDEMTNSAQLKTWLTSVNKLWGEAK
jgi:hypothetical protein